MRERSLRAYRRMDLLQEPLDQDDVIAIGFENGQPVFATLRSIFDDQALVAVHGRDDQLVTVHTDNIIRVKMGPACH